MDAGKPDPMTGAGSKKDPAVKAQQAESGRSGPQKKSPPQAKTKTGKQGGQKAGQKMGPKAGQNKGPNRGPQQGKPGGAKTGQQGEKPASPGNPQPSPQEQIKRLRQRLLETEAQLSEKSFPLAGPAKMRRRHWGLVFSFVLMVLIPILTVTFYLVAVAEDQYQSITGFTVRGQESGAATDLLGGLASFAPSSSASDSDILYEFIQSQEMVAAVAQEVDLQSHYGQHWPRDWAFSIWPDATQEEMIWYWQRIVGISYDSSSGLIEVQAQAFDPETAQAITRAIVKESQIRINALNEQARADAISYAQVDLEEAVEKLKVAREALTQFRTRTRIVDPEADIQGRMGVMNNLQQQLATALIDYDLLRGTVAEGDPRLKKGQQLIDVIRQRIDSERQTFTSSNTDTGAVGEDYPSLISEFERLTVDRQYAEESYRAALTGLAMARDEATRQSRYLATYIKPTRPQQAEYPQRLVLVGLAALFLLLLWSILALIYYSIRDRS